VGLPRASSPAWRVFLQLQEVEDGKNVVPTFLKNVETFFKLLIKNS
jgi:hypothetical protein